MKNKQSKGTKTLAWKVHTPGLLKEILVNPQCGILVQPIRIFANVLAEVATRASEINDPKLNALMIRLTLYSVADPEHQDYNKDICDIVINKFYNKPA